MEKHMKVIFIVILIVFSTFCIGRNQTQTYTKTPQIQSLTSTQTTLRMENSYSNWLKNKTKYFTIYYPSSVANYEKFMAKIRALLIGIDYTYESYARAFGKEPQKIELYIYPSENDLKLDYSTDLPWYIEGNKIFTFLDKESKELYHYNVESALIAYLTNNVNGLTFIFPAVSEAYSRSLPQKKAAFDELVKLTDSQNLEDVKEHWDNMVDLVTFLISKFGVNEVFRLLQSDKPSQEILKLPNVEGEYQKFEKWLWNGGIVKGVGRMKEVNITLELNERERVYSATSKIKIEYSTDYFPIFYKSPYLDVRNMNTNYFQNFDIVIPLERRDEYEFSYIGNFTIEPITTDKSFKPMARARYITPNLTILPHYYLSPFIPTTKLISSGKIEVKSDRQVITSEFPSSIPVVVTGNFKKFTGYVNGTKVNFYYTSSIDAPSNTFKDILEAIRVSKEYFPYPKEVNIIYAREGGEIWTFSSNLMAISTKWRLSIRNFMWYVSYFFFRRIDIKPEQLWAYDSLWAPIYASYLKKFSDYFEYEKRMYITALREFPETDHPLTELYKYWYSEDDRKTIYYKAYLTTLFISSQAGKEAYRKAFIEFSKKYLYKEADFNEFARILAEKSNNPNIIPIWQTWTTKKALPNITVENAQLIKNGNNYTLKLTISDKNGFAFPLKVEGITWQGKRTETIKAFYTGKPIEIELVFPGEPKEIIIYGAPMLSKNFEIETDGIKISIRVP